MRSIRVVWFIAFLLMISPLAVGQSLVAVRRHAPGATAGEAGNPAKHVRPGQPGFSPDRRGTGGRPGSLERPADPLRPGGGERDPSSAGAVSPPRPSQVWLYRHEVTVSVVDGIAVTEIDQTFRNEANFQMEGTYLCPLPPNAVINGFSIFMGGREIHGMVMERTEARRIYDRIVGRNRDPGLVELAGPGDAIRTSIFPIPAHGEMRVRTRYACLLDGRADSYRASIPFPVAESERDRPIAEVRVDFSLRSSWPVRLEALDGLRTRTRDGGRYWSGTLRKEDYRAKGNLEIDCTTSRKEPGLTVNVHVGPQGERTFVAIIGAGRRKLSAPRLRFEGAKVLSMFPKKIPVVPAGGQTLVFGRLEGTARPVVTLNAHEGFTAVRIRNQVEEIATTAESTKHIPCFYARNQVDALLAGRRLDPEDRQEIISLSVLYGILTPYTAFLAK